ncbi:hypothetical protein CS0771_43520 [Catellatospora sp. IY07-71]|nr:hypothetical protein CS0771_43520 [Catellatospora sp. IY07-71]
MVCTVGAYRNGMFGPRLVETRGHQPQAVRLPGEHDAPRVITIGVTWPDNGYCSGQLTASAIETATEVRVQDVVSREYVGGACAGLGTMDGMAWDELQLAEPLGERVVVRDSDGVRLPVFERLTPP